MTVNEIEALLDKLLEQTKRQVVKWKGIKAGILRVDFPRSSIELIQAAPGAEGYALIIYNSAGVAIDTISPTTMPQVRGKLASLYQAAYNAAFEIDATLQDILAGVEGRDVSGEDIAPGIYVATFTALNSSTPNQGLAIFGDGVINGGDNGYIYRGSYQLTDRRMSANLLITQWNQNVPTIFGPSLPSFNLVVSGQLGSNLQTISLEGVVSQHTNMRLRIVCRRLADAERPR